VKKNVASQVVAAQLVSKTDGSAITTGTCAVYVTKDGGTQALGSGGAGSPSGYAAHEGNGTWTYTPTQGESNAAHVVFTFVHASAVAVAVQVYPVEYNDIADAFLKRDWTQVTGEAARSALNALRFLRNKWSIGGSTLTVTKEDDATSAWTSALTTSASAEAVTSSDPA
jgi:hypothetical protein